MHLCTGVLHLFVGAMLYRQNAVENDQGVRKTENHAVWETKELGKLLLRRWASEGHVGEALQYLNKFCVKNQQWRNLNGEKQGSRL